MKLLLVSLLLFLIPLSSDNFSEQPAVEGIILTELPIPPNKSLSNESVSATHNGVNLFIEVNDYTGKVNCEVLDENNQLVLNYVGYIRKYGILPVLISGLDSPGSYTIFIYTGREYTGTMTL